MIDIKLSNANTSNDIYNLNSCKNFYVIVFLSQLILILIYVGVFACNNIKETINATKYEKHRMVDEKKKVP